MSTSTWFPKRSSVFGLIAFLLGASCNSTPEKPPPVTGCTIAGTAYADGAANPQGPCQSCQLAVSATAWTNIADGTLCNQGTAVCTGGACRPGCYIGQMFYAAPDLDPTNSCKICHPAATTQAWSDLPAGTMCADGGICTGGLCQVGCYIQGVVYPDRSDNAGDKSLCCNQKGNPTDWTARLVPANSYDLGGAGADIVAADFNGDGAADLAAIDLVHDWVSVLLSDGNGGFLPLQTYATDSAPRALVAVDLNGDGKADLAVKSSGQKTLDVLINQGDGTFNPQKTYPAGNGGPGSMVAGDFDGDKKQDVVCSQYEDGVVYFPGLGNGDLAAGIPVLDAGGGTLASGVLLGDGVLDLFNGDADGGIATLLIGNGDGGYTPGGSVPLTPPPLDVFLGDVNGDGIADITFSTSADVQVFFGTGGGMFAAPVRFLSNLPPAGFGFADLNGSGKGQLLVSVNGVGVLGAGLLSDGGTAQGVFPVATLAGPTARMAVGDFNGDHAPDVAILYGTGISVFLNGCP